ncbi:MAG: hypothetical protein HY520_00625 [Candidatus Aenigmarchaeota archaeon]|nr:hypothetical protein [Candidatus Aenigmarchaeota archaeon]
MKTSLLERALREVGLSPVEARCYLSLLQRGPQSAGELAKFTGLNRSHCYEVLGRLWNLGLVCTSLPQSSPSRYVVSSPEVLRSKWKRKARFVEGVLGALKSIGDTPPLEGDTRFSIYDGIGGLKVVLEDLISQGKPYYVLGFAGAVAETLQQGGYKAFQKRRVAAGIRRHLIAERQRAREEVIHQPFSQVRFLPPGVHLPIGSWTYGDRTVLFIPGLHPTIMLVEGLGFSETYRTYFNLLWSVCSDAHPSP